MSFIKKISFVTLIFLAMCRPDNENVSRVSGGDSSSVDCEKTHACLKCTDSKAFKAPLAGCLLINSGQYCLIPVGGLVGMDPSKASSSAWTSGSALASARVVYEIRLKSSCSKGSGAAGALFSGANMFGDQWTYVKRTAKTSATSSSSSSQTTNKTSSTSQSSNSSSTSSSVCTGNSSTNAFKFSGKIYVTMANGNGCPIKSDSWVLVNSVSSSGVINITANSSVLDREDSAKGANCPKASETSPVTGKLVGATSASSCSKGSSDTLVKALMK